MIKGVRTVKLGELETNIKDVQMQLCRCRCKISHLKLVAERPR